MADYFTQYSVQVEARSVEEFAWFTARCEEMFGAAPEEWSETAPWAADLAREILGLDPEDLCGNPEYKMEEPRELYKFGSVWFHEDTSGSPIIVALLMVYYLRTFHPKGCFSIIWADTCSKPRLDGFGGGAHFVTADGIQSMSVYDWVADLEREHKRKRSNELT